MKNKFANKCYKCKYRRKVPVSAHSSCVHPATQINQDPLIPLIEVMAIFASVGRAAPTVNVEAATKLSIMANKHGIDKGWFNWPYNFDPVWLMNCKGFSMDPKLLENLLK